MRFYPIEINGKTYELSSVTTQIQYFVDAGLIDGYNYIPPENLKKAAAIGDQVHDIIKRINLGEVIEYNEWSMLSEPVKQSVKAYVRWKEDNKFRPKHVEMTVYSLKYGYAGRLDAVGTIARRLTMLDWKTGIYKEDLCKLQMALYSKAYLEIHPNRRLDFIRTVMLDKITGNFSEHLLTMGDIDFQFSRYLDLKAKSGLI
jgi:hypothetical protein